MRFYNVMKSEYTEDAVEEKYGRFYIKMGFCGFNSPANNGMGYASQKRAEAAILRYQNR